MLLNVHDEQCSLCVTFSRHLYPRGSCPVRRLKNGVELSDKQLLMSFPVSTMMVILLLTTMCADTAGSLLVARTVPVADRSGWTTFSVMLRKEISETADTAVGEVPVAVVRTTMTCPFPAVRVLLQVRTSSNGHNSTRMVN